MSETYTATVDRIVDGETAVMLLEGDDETIDELNLHVSELPQEAAQEGMVVELTLADGEVVSTTAKPEETQERLTRNRKRLDRLSKRLSEEDT